MTTEMSTKSWPVQLPITVTAPSRVKAPLRNLLSTSDQRPRRDRAVSLAISAQIVGHLHKTVPVLSEAEVSRIVAAIQAGRLAPSRATDRVHRQHVQRLQAEKGATRRAPRP
jgi:hypothetical protein